MEHMPYINEYIIKDDMDLFILIYFYTIIETTYLYFIIYMFIKIYYDSENTNHADLIILWSSYIIFLSVCLIGFGYLNYGVYKDCKNYINSKQSKKIDFDKLFNDDE